MAITQDAVEIQSGAQMLPIIQRAENSGDDAVSPAGAVGRYQIMPGTARQYGFDPTKLKDPAYNEQVATHITNDLWQRFNGDPEAVLVAYNAGPGVARKWQSGGRDQALLPDETQKYLANSAPYLKVNGQPLPVRAPVRSEYVTDIPAQTPDARPAPGAAQADEYAKAGFSADEIQQWRDQKNQDYLKAGFTPNEIEAYWGNKDPDPSHVDKHLQQNIATAAPAYAPAIAKSPMDQFAAGWDMSVAGLASNQSLPKTVLPEDAGLSAKILAGGGQLIGDLPAAAAGFFGGAAAGGAIGTAVPVVGNVIGALGGAGAGSAMVPQTMREVMLDYYKRGDIHSASDFLGMAGKSLLNIGKVGAVGAVAMPLGGVVGSKVVTPIAGKFIGAAANTGTQVATFTGLSAALEGHMPDKDDFIAGATLAAAAHVAGGVIPKGTVEAPATKQTAAKMETIYRETGVPPWDLAQRMQTDRVVKGEVLAEDPSGQPVIPKIRASITEPEPYAPPPKVDAFHGPLPEDDGIAMSDVSVNVGRAHPDYPKLEEAQQRALHGGNYTPFTGKDGRGYRLVNLEDADGSRKIVAYNAKNEQIGSLVYDTEVEASGLPINPSASVVEEYRRQGIATAMYDLADKTGGKIPPVEQAGQVRSEDATAFRAARGEGGKTKFGDVGGRPPALPPKPPGNGPDDIAPPAPGPKGPKLEAPEPMSPEILNEIAGEFIHEPVASDKLLDPSRNYRQWISELGPARAIDTMLLDQGFDRNRQMGLEDMFRQTYASDTRTGYFIKKGALDPVTLEPMLRQNPETGEMVPVPPVEAAVKEVKASGGNLRDWLNYMVAERANKLEERGIEHGHPLDQTQRDQLLAAGEGKYAAASSSLQETLNAGLEYGVGSGVFSEKQIEAMKRDNPMYVSFRRVSGDDTPQPQSRGRGFKVREPVSRIEGDDRKIRNPLLATVDNLNQIIRMSDRNRAIGSVVTLAEMHGDLAADLGLKRIGAPEVKQSIAEPGSDTFKPYDVNSGEPYEPFLAQRAMRGQFKPNQFMYIRGGKPELWEAKDEALASLLRGADSPGEANVVVRLAQGVASMQRAGIVNMADFPVRNTMRDQISAFILDPHSPPPFLMWARGAMDVFKQSDRYWDWVGKGGAGSALVDMDLNHVERSVNEVFNETGTFGKMWNTVRHPLEAMQIISERIDAASRLGYAKGLETDGIDSIKAATMGRKAMLDFVEKGTSAFVQQWARATPFMRPTFLNMKQFGEAITNDPGGVALKSFAAITVPTIAFNLLNYFQDKYGGLPEVEKAANLPRYYKDGMYILPQIGGIRLHIPYPPIVGAVFGGLTTRFMDHFLNEDPQAFEQWGHTVLAQLIPPFIPSIILPPLEQIANRNFFTGHPLIPGSLEKASGPMQYTENTTAPAKAMSQYIKPLGIDVSPIVIENYAKNWAGSIGMAALKALDVPFKASGKPWEMADVPFVGSFLIRNPGMSAQPIQDFFDQRQDFTQGQADMRLAKKRAMLGQGQELDQQAADYVPPNAPDNIANSITNMQAIIQAVNADKTMTNDEKRQFTDDLYGNMIEMAKGGLTIMKALKQQSRLAAPPMPDIVARH